MKTVSQVTLTFVEIFMSRNFHFFFIIIIIIFPDSRFRIPDSGFHVLGKPQIAQYMVGKCCSNQETSRTFGRPSGDFRGVFIHLVENDILTMPRF